MNTTARKHDISLQLSSYREASAALGRLLELLLEAPEFLLQPDVGNDVLTAICNLQEEARRAGEAALVVSEEHADHEPCPENNDGDERTSATTSPPHAASGGGQEARTQARVVPINRGLSVSVEVLCFDVPEALELLEGNLERDLMLDSLQRIEQVCAKSLMHRFDLLDDGVKVHLYGYIVAQCLALQESSCASDKPTLRRRVQAIFTAIKAHTPGVFIHGMARGHKPRARTWREDMRAHREALEGMLGVCDSATGAAKKRAPAEHEARGATEVAPEHTLCEGLEDLATRYPEHLVVLPSAYESARDAQGFIQTGRALSLVERLVTDYLPALERGGDALAREVFTPCEYSATESESTRSSKRAMELRTFTYNNEPRQFLKHLRIGTSPSPLLGWRCYFFHDADRQRIVIGHCGAHLDLR